MVSNMRIDGVELSIYTYYKGEECEYITLNTNEGEVDFFVNGEAYYNGTKWIILRPEDERDEVVFRVNGDRFVVEMNDSIIDHVYGAYLEGKHRMGLI